MDAFPQIQRGPHTLLGYVPESRFVICIETSALSLPYLADIKRYVIEALTQKAEKNDNSYFNVFVFNSEITQWSNELVQCTTETVAVCSDWLKSIHSNSTSNMLDALLAALSDKKVEAIYLIVCGPPDQEKDQILDHVAHVSLDRPIHCRLVLGKVDESRDWKLMEQRQQATSILEAIARDTEGSFYIIEPRQSSTTINQAPVGYSQMSCQPQDCVLRTETGHIYSANMSNVSVTTTLKGDPIFKPKFPVSDKEEFGNSDFPCYHPYSRWPQVPYPPYTTWSRYSIANKHNAEDTITQDDEISKSMFSSFKGISPNATALIIGRKVLARHAKNGLYYLGVVKAQKENDVFLIAYAPVDDEYFESTEYQSTRLLELSDYEDAMRHCILPGDRVLAPDPDREFGKPLTFYPGTVLEGKSIRDGIGVEPDTAFESTSHLTIALTAPANRTVSIPSDQPVFIPDPLFRRLCLEGAMPQNARQTLSNVLAYPEKTLPGYPTSGSKRLPHEYQVVRPKLMKGRELQVDHLLPPFCLPVYPVMETMERNHRGEVGWIPDWYAVGEASGIKVEHDENLKEQEKIPGTKWTVKTLREEVEKVLKLRPGESVTQQNHRGLSVVIDKSDKTLSDQGLKSLRSDGKKSDNSSDENQSNTIISKISLENELDDQFEWIKQIDTKKLESVVDRKASFFKKKNSLYLSSEKD